jgi:hypothetical protein
MQSKRRNTSVLAPITPEFPETTTNRTNSAHEIARLKGQLAAERRRHQRLEQAFGKYLAILENTVTELREAYLFKNEPLVRNPLRGDK